MPDAMRHLLKDQSSRHRELGQFASPRHRHGAVQHTPAGALPPMESPKGPLRHLMVWLRDGIPPVFVLLLGK